MQEVEHQVHQVHSAKSDWFAHILIKHLIWDLQCLFNKKTTVNSNKYLIKTSDIKSATHECDSQLKDKVWDKEDSEESKEEKKKEKISD